MSPVEMTDRMLEQIARLEVRIEQLEKLLTELRPLLLERSGAQARLEVLELEVRELKVSSARHDRLAWGLAGALALFELLNLVLPNGLRGIFHV